MNREKLESYLEQNPFAKLSDVVTQILYDEIVVLDVPPASKLNINQIATDLGYLAHPRRGGHQPPAGDRLRGDEAALERLLRHGHEYARHDRPLRRAHRHRDARRRRSARENASAEAIAQMDSLATEFKKAVPKLDGIRLKETDMPFHKLIVDSCGNKYLIRSYNELLPNLKMYQGSWTKFINPGSTNLLVEPGRAPARGHSLGHKAAHTGARAPVRWRTTSARASTSSPTATTRATPSPYSSACPKMPKKEESRHMKIAMIGSGAAGSVFAALPEARRGGYVPRRQVQGPYGQNSRRRPHLPLQGRGVRAHRLPHHGFRR